MSKGLKAFAIFAAMIAVPIVADNFISKRPDVPLFSGVGWRWLPVPALILGAAAIPFVIFAYWKFEEEIEEIEGRLKLAERELLAILGDNWDQSRRHAKVEERAKWNAMAQTPSVQIFREGYRTVAHEAFELNRADMAKRGTGMGKAVLTAALLRELYQGGVSRAKEKVSGEIENGNTPFVAPGIRELIGFDNPKFPKEGGVNWVKLTLAVNHGQFPKELMLVNKTPEGTRVMRGWEVIMQLTQQRPPGWQNPRQARPASMLRLWLQWLFTIE